MTTPSLSDAANEARAALADNNREYFYTDLVALLAAVEERLADDELRRLCAIQRHSVREGSYIEWMRVEPRNGVWHKVTPQSPFGVTGEPLPNAVAALRWVREQEAAK